MRPAGHALGPAKMGVGLDPPIFRLDGESWVSALDSPEPFPAGSKAVTATLETLSIGQTTPIRIKESLGPSSYNRFNRPLMITSCLKVGHTHLQKRTLLLFSM